MCFSYKYLTRISLIQHDIWDFCLEVGSQYVVQGSSELLGSINLPASVSQMAETTGTNNPIRLMYWWDSCLFVLLGTKTNSRQIFYH